MVRMAVSVAFSMNLAGSRFGTQTESHSLLDKSHDSGLCLEGGQSQRHLVLILGEALHTFRNTGCMAELRESSPQTIRSLITNCLAKEDKLFWFPPGESSTARTNDGCLEIGSALSHRRWTHVQDEGECSRSALTPTTDTFSRLSNTGPPDLEKALLASTSAEAYAM
ncbi:hypothetical protein LIA77_04567 [Sarocladium implicatum]|nr:hypothetical protein LIA77_04567 [Sarocladium implicatum]